MRKARFARLVRFLLSYFTKQIFTVIFIYFLLFALLFVVSVVVLFGARVLWSLFRIGRRKPTDAVRYDTTEDKERLTRIKTEFKRMGENIDYEEVHPIDGSFEK